ncbi:APL6 [[Candida] subhashii]|uniref:APL6 n=1 Tax=[Candida] subhashii TaxID=561895 RepID=A0A8J5QTH6_9ASCO|nr:APL6 [[Candida] subhashii]KAG7666008.1 APL6 [[Candida] subhashii]
MSDSFAKLSSMMESAKEFTIEAAVSASARLTETPSASRPAEVSKLLNSRIDRDILKGMKCVVSIISRGENGLPYFADVVKNVTSSNGKIKQLVVIYLTKYADLEPDTALLSINSIQKSLNEKNQINRANAIRSLAGIRISSIAPILDLCIKRTSTDPSPLVRAATAISIGKAYEISEHSKKSLVEYLNRLLADSEPLVVSSALKSYYRIGKDYTNETKKWAPIHGHFRRLCSLLLDFDEWTQCLVVDLLTEYSRKFLPRPKLYSKDGSNQIIDLPEDIREIPFEEYETSFDEDLELFLHSLKPLIYSNSENVILSIVRSVYLLATPLVFKEFQLDSILTRIATSYDESQIRLYALQTIAFINNQTNIFNDHFRKFYVMPTDSSDIATCKLSILSSMSNEGNFKYIFEELKYYSLHSRDANIRKESIKTIGKCSQISLEWSQKILKWSLARIKDSNGDVLNELLKVIRYLLQQKSDRNDPKEKEEVLKTTYKLSLILQDHSFDLDDEAKAGIIWLIGEYTALGENSFGPDVLRSLLKTFPGEAASVRYQILVLACKIFSFDLARLKNEIGTDDQDYIEEKLSNSIEYKMFQHVLQLSKYDESYDTRDRARMFNVLLNTGPDQAQLASLFLQVPKPIPFISTENDDIVAPLSKYFTVVEWTSDPSLLPPSSIRKPVTVQVNSLSTPGFSSKEVTNNIPIQSFTNTAISSEQAVNVEKTTASKSKPAYQLQSLDEFFGNEASSSEEEEVEESDEESDESETSIEDSSSEDEESEEEEEDDEHEQLKDHDDDDESDADSTKAFIK